MLTFHPKHWLIATGLMLLAGTANAQTVPYPAYNLCDQPAVCNQVNGTVIPTLNNKVYHILYNQAATVGTATGTTEQTLGTYTLPAGMLDVTGRHLRITATMLAANNADVKTMKCYHGASVGSISVTVSAATVAKCQLDVIKTGASTQQVVFTALNGAAVIAGTVTAGTDTDTAAIVI